MGTGIPIMCPMANINNGGKTPIAGVIHALVLLLIFLFLMPYAVYIPLSTLSAILIIVAYNMSEWKTFLYLLKGDKHDVVVLLITFFLTVVIDLTVAIEVGVIMAIVLFIKRISETSSVKLIESPSIQSSESTEMLPSDIDYLTIPKGVEVYEIDGPFFFGLASKLDELDSSAKKIVNIRIIRLRNVPFIDSTGMNNLRNLLKRSKKERIIVLLSGVNSNVYDSMLKSGFIDEFGEDYIFPHIQMALDKAKDLISKISKKK